MKINLLNPVYSRTDSPKLIRDCLSFGKTIWKKSQHRKIAKEIKIYKINREGYFYTGLIPKIQEYCKQNNIPLEITKSPEYVELIESIPIDRSRTLPGITLRDDQNRLVDAALKHKRGVIVSVTGSGKTVVALQIMNCFPESNILFLVPNITLLGQTINELNNFGFDSICKLGEGNKTINDERIVVSTIQTFKKLDLDSLSDYFDLILCDEVHLAFRNMATFEQILSKLLAPYRIGLTASHVETEEQKILTKGLLGSIIETVTMEEAREIGMLAEPIVKLIPVTKCKTTINLKTYQDIHKEAICNYSLRNKLIVNEAEELAEEGLTSVIFVNELDHGEQIYNLMVKTNLACVFASSELDSNERNRIKSMLENKQIDCMISTIGKEGLNIKSLGAVILADIGKSNISLVQQIGRALRKTDVKHEAYIIDFIDDEKYLSQHFVNRLKYYIEQGWKIQ